MLRISWSYIKGYKKNTIVCILGIAFSVMLMFSLIDMSGRVLNQYRNLMLSSSTYDIMIQNISLESMNEIYQELQNGDCEKSKMIWFADSRVQSKMTSVHIIGVEGQWQSIANVTLLDGKLPTNNYEICIEKKYSEEIGVTIGDQLEIVLLDQDQKEYPIKFMVSGIISNAPTPYDSYYVYTSISTAERIMSQEDFESDNLSNQVSILFDRYTYQYEKINEVVMNLSKQYGTRFYSEHIVPNEKKIASFDEKGTYSDISKGMNIVVLFVFICMTIFIFNVISIQTTQKIRQFGVLRCIGIDIKGLIRILFYEVFFYTICGLILGILCGRALNHIVANVIIGFFLPIQGIEYKGSIWLYFLTGILTVASICIAVTGMFFKMAKQNPVQMLSYAEKAKTMKHSKTSGNWIYDIAYRNLQRNKSRYRIMLITMTLVAALIMLIGNSLTIINFNTHNTYFSFADIEIYSNPASNTPYLSNKVISNCKNSGKIEEIYWQLYERYYNCKADNDAVKSICLLVYSDNLMEKLLDYNELEKMNIKKENIAILATEESGISCSNVHISASDHLRERYPIAKNEYDIKVDDVIKVSLSTMNGKLVPHLDGGAYLIINERVANEIIGEVSDFTNVFIECHDSLNKEGVQNLIQNTDYNVVDLRYTMEESQKQLSGLLVLCLYLLISVAILCIFIIMNTVKANFNQRIKEIGMLRGIGGEKEAIRKMMCYEIMITAIRALVLASIISTPISVYVYYIVNESIGCGFLGYVLSILTVLVGCYLISRSMIERCLKINTTDLLHYE